MIVLVFIAIAIILACIVLLMAEVRGYVRRTRNKQQECALGPALKSPELNWAGITWIISLTLLCVGIVAYGYLYPRATFLPIAPGPVSGHPAYLQGYNIWCGLLLWLIFKNTIGRNQGGVKSAVSLVAISGSVLAVIVLNHWQSAVAMNEIQRQVSSLASSDSSAQWLSESKDPSSDTPRARGEFGEIERFFKTWLNQMASLRRDYAQELEAVGWDTILAPERLARDSTLIRSQWMLQKAKDIVAKYRTWTYVLYENAEQGIPSLPISERLRYEIASAFKRVKVQAHARHDELWALKVRIIAKCEEILALLSSRRDGWAVEDGRIVFANDSDLNLFNTYVSEIEKLLAAEEALEKQSIEDLNNALRSLDY